MAVRYVSRHHSPEDPGGLIAEALALGADFPGPAEDLLLAWSLRLAEDLPAQEAARRLIERHGLAAAALPGAAGRLVAALPLKVTVMTLRLLVTVTEPLGPIDDSAFRAFWMSAANVALV